MDLEDYRREISRVDTEIVDAISRRMNVVEEAQQYKREKGMEIKDKGRKEKMKQQFEKLFERKDLPKEKGRELAELLVKIPLKEKGRAK